MKWLVLVLLALAAPLAVLWAQHARDHFGGYYDPVERRLAWHNEFPRCLP